MPRAGNAFVQLLNQLCKMKPHAINSDSMTFHYPICSQASILCPNETSQDPVSAKSLSPSRMDRQAISLLHTTAPSRDEPPMIIIHRSLDLYSLCAHAYDTILHILPRTLNYISAAMKNPSMDIYEPLSIALRPAILSQPSKYQTIRSHFLAINNGLGCS